MELTRQQIAKINSYLPLYIYDYEIIKRQISKLRKCLPANTEIFYSAKANPNVAILKTMNNFGLGLEIISEGEFLAAQKAGFKPDEMLFGGSTRSDSELNLIAHKNIGLISLESISEVKRLNKIAKIFGRKIKVLLRFQPDERYRYGNSLKDLDKMLVNFSGRFPFLVLKGIHEYVQSRVYSVRPFIGQLDHFFSIISHLEKKFDLTFEIIDIGGGFGSARTKEFSVPDFCKGLNFLLKKYGFKKRKIILELGRYLIARSGFYIIKIIEFRKHGGVNYLITEGIVNNYYAVKPDKLSKYFWPVDNFKMNIIGHKSVKRGVYPVLVCGQMSSLADIVGRDNRSYFSLPEAKQGDLFIIKDVGAYGLTWAHSLLGTRPIAAEFMLFNNKLELIRDKVEPADLLNYQRIPAFLRKKQIL